MRNLQQNVLNICTVPVGGLDDGKEVFYWQMNPPKYLRELKWHDCKMITFRCTRDMIKKRGKPAGLPRGYFVF